MFSTSIFRPVETKWKQGKIYGGLEACTLLAKAAKLWLLLYADGIYSPHSLTFLAGSISGELIVSLIKQKSLEQPRASRYSDGQCSLWWICSFWSVVVLCRGSSHSKNKPQGEPSWVHVKTLKPILSV